MTSIVFIGLQNPLGNLREKMNASPQESHCPHVISQEDVLQNDVLLCRGKTFHYHVGNIEYRRLVSERASTYQSPESTIVDRDTIAREVLQGIQGRFLQPLVPGVSWKECSPGHARRKVKQALRDAHRPDTRDTSRSQLTRASSSVTPSVAQNSGRSHLVEGPTIGSDLFLGRSTFQRDLSVRSLPETYFDQVHQERRRTLTGSRIGFHTSATGDGISLFDRSRSELNFTMRDGPLLLSNQLVTEEESLRICYDDLLRGQATPNSSRLDNDTIEILRRLQEQSDT